MKRVDFFICSMSSGGAEHQLAELTNRLSESYEVHITTFSNLPDHYYLNPEIKRNNISKDSNIKTLFAIWKYIFSLKTDCLFVFGQRESKISLWPIILRKRFKVIACERNLNCGPLSLSDKILFRFLYKRVDRIITNSYSQAEFLSHQNISQSKLMTITNFTDINSFKYDYKVPGEQIRFGVFARYAPQKNYERFLNAIKLVTERIDIPFEVFWYGTKTGKNGHESIDYQKFCSIISYLKIDKYVHPNDAVLNVISEISKCDFLVLPSVHEGFSNSISEAICMGKPMIVSDVSDNSVMVKDGVNGILFDPYDINSMANAIIQMLELPMEVVKKMGVESREIAEILFDEKKFLQQYTEVIEGA